MGAAAMLKIVLIGLLMVFFMVGHSAATRVSKDVYKCPKRRPTFRDGHSVPHPGNCNRFIICSYGVAFSYKCQKGLVYDPQSKSCVFSWQYECIVSTTQKTTPNGKTTTTTLEPDTTTEPLVCKDNETLCSMAGGLCRDVSEGCEHDSGLGLFVRRGCIGHPGCMCCVDSITLRNDHNLDRSCVLGYKGECRYIEYGCEGGHFLTGNECAGGAQRLCCIQDASTPATTEELAMITPATTEESEIPTITPATTEESEIATTEQP